ncbi:anti-sigma factor antagonist [Aeromicrobium fastidiosum]|uniref:anti-sigma factor antagonist n=1 Tax=Aeromicrobium fastidiosum TaxID=52699 RepID=UPI0020235885|nr:anti-sigma factor antagonist [Aeromicrobium fastidiosum]MCL8252177.1 anti-sigma factor antagonist [Aeromicrobium fastidiosum]
MRSVVSVRLHTDDRTIGALNLYSRTAGSFTTSDVAIAMTFARHASIALASSEEIFHLKIAVDSRKVVGQAQGILMERFGIGGDRAFDVLRRYSQTSNVKLSVVAQRVVDERRLPVAAVPGPAAVVVAADPTPIAVTSRDDAPYRVLAVAGDIDILTAPDFVEIALAAVDAGEVRLVVDLRETTFVDSSGLSSFVLLEKAVTTRGGSLDVVGPIDRVHRVFSMAGLDLVIHLHATMDEARASHDDPSAVAG